MLFEGDSKIYINALCSVSDSTNWVIQPSISSILSLVQCFVSFSFTWVNRTCNSTVHVVARCSFLSSFSFFYFKDILLADLAAVCMEGYPPL